MAERIVNDIARYIRERFPDKKQSIDRLMAEDPGFLSLCDDYDVCVNALLYWSKSGEPEAEIRVNEYHTIARELEEEVVEALIAQKR
jgi:hypothetical protein